MHNKSWIADNRIALAGGRNIGDEYFAASEAVNFFDLDFLVLGPAVPELSRSFDAYWNSPAAYPVSALSPELANAQSLATLRANAAGTLAKDHDSVYVRALAASDLPARIGAGQLALQWSARWQVLADDPMKALGDGAPTSHVLEGLRTALADANAQVTIISPYFVPGKEGTAHLVDRVQAGRQVAILTNSLAANDVAAVHGGYSKYRKELVAGGVALYELKPTAGSGNEKKSWFGSSGASLHTKAAVFDHDEVFVGSFNLDPRSAMLNC
jgi:putative cardiolipin synthase